jgi:hypothetical protein
MVSSLAFKYNGHMISGLDARYPNTGMDNSWESSIWNNYDDCIWNYWCGNSNRTVENTFFRKPRICIGKLKPYPKDITITSLSPEEEAFEGVVWCLPILHSKWKVFSTNTSNCRIWINIIENNTAKYDQGIPLYWLRGRQLPKKCHLGASLVGTKTPRKEYADRLPFAYLTALDDIASSNTSLPKGGGDESIFLFTYPESQSLYIISSLWQTEEQTNHFILSYKVKYDVRINFSSDKYSSIEKRFSLFAKSWRDVRFCTHFSEIVHKYCHCRRCPCTTD